nr:hypothetical protein [Tanacetum cinerariifolium]
MLLLEIYKSALKSEDSKGGHWKSRSKKKKKNKEEDDLSQPWVCEEIDPFTPRIHYFDFLKKRMPIHIKTYDGRTARVWFDDLPDESIDSYDDLKKAFLENYLQQKKCIKDPIEIHNIKQRDGESTKDFMKRYKLESRDVKGAPECMRISGFVHGITNLEQIKRLHNKIPKMVDEMMRVTMSFLRGEVAASNHEQKKSFPPWKQQEGYKIGECMHLKKQIEEMLKAGKLSHLIKKLKQNNGKEQPKAGKNRETSGKDKALDILMDEGTQGPMIIEAEIGGHCIHCMYVDGGSASKILYEHYFSRLRPEIRNLLVPATTPLIRFSGEIIWPIGKIQLLVKIEDEEHSISAWMNFMVVSGMIPLECAMVFGSEGNLPITKQIVEERLKVAINQEYLEQTIMIGSTLTERGRNKLCDLLQHNLDIFTWKPADMTGVLRHIAKHCLNVWKGCSPVRQKKRGQAADRNQAVQEEVRKLMEAGIMKEVQYHDWLSNPAMVKKHYDSWRMCVDFKDLNKACPKEGYLLPEID